MRGTLVSAEEYIATAYQPDCEFLEGVLLERNVGEKDHSRVQALVIGELLQQEAQSGTVVFPEQRVQVRPDRFRVPDVCVMVAPVPDQQIFLESPLLCIDSATRDGLKPAGGGILKTQNPEIVVDAAAIFASL